MKAPTEAQAAAWLRTVIAPVLFGLDRVLEHTERGDWTYRPATGELQKILAVAAMVPGPYRPNLAQMIRQGERLRVVVAAYETARDSLVVAARAAHHALVTSSAFLATRPEQRATLAAYVVNNQRELPRYFDLFELWQDIGAELFAQRQGPPFVALDRAGAAVERCAEDLLTLSVSLRDALADRYGLPAVEAPPDR